MYVCLFRKYVSPLFIFNHNDEKILFRTKTNSIQIIRSEPIPQGECMKTTYVIYLQYVFLYASKVINNKFRFNS